MGLFRSLLAPIRWIARFPIVQFAVVVAGIFWLQAADSNSVFGEIFSALDWLVDLSVRQLSEIFEVKSFTRSWLTLAFMIGYVYLAVFAILVLASVILKAVVEVAARTNILGLRNAIARQRGIVAYRAWLPLERIRPEEIAQARWEEMFAWPANNKPPYPSLGWRLARGLISWAAVMLIVAVLLQEFTLFPILTWLGNAIRMHAP